MGRCMKTTVEISDALLEEARRTAGRERTTVRALIEEGLRQVLRARALKPAFRLRRATFKGRGLQPDIAAAGWDRLRDLAYQGRGA
jgi:Bacterial antitoxin of type II TA system, VapB